MSKATDRIKEMRKQNNMKNNNTKHNKVEQLTEEQQKLNKKYNNPTYEEVKAIIEKHKENGTIYAPRTKDEALRYINNFKYTVDIIATYSCSAHNKHDYDETTMCIMNAYLVVRETGECILVDHIWLSEYLAHIPVGIYTSMYKNERGGEVFINRLKTMKYAYNYTNNGKKDIRYGLSSENKTTRANWVKKQQTEVGINMTINEIRAML